jgi:methanogenic corrinoid protein MtbC1
MAHDVQIDTDTFVRTASRFALKRDAFAPDAVEMLASDIVRRLSRAAARAPRFEDPVVSEDSIAAFCAALVQPEPAPALDFIRRQRDAGLTRQGVYLGFVGAAARRLGEGWDAGDLSFAEVTIGTGHLYALMRALRAEGPPAGLAFDARRHALFATVPGETHGIGITMAADLFREAGWEIDLQVGRCHDGLLARVEGEQPDIVGLSLSTDHRLADLVRLVVGLRLVVPHAIVGVAPGADLDDDQITEIVDIDLLFHDARTACADLDRLIRVRSCPPASDPPHLLPGI